MSGSLESRVERRFMEIEDRLRGHGVGSGVQHLKKLVPISTNYVDEKVDKYLFYLKKAYREAPCGGCKKLVKSAIVGARIYQKMELDTLKRESISDEQILEIKEQVERELESSL